jgi:Xaa-Pro dipeptidase
MTTNHSHFSRRQFIGSGAALAIATAPSSLPIEGSQAFATLKPLGDRVKPISTEEFQERTAHAQKLMADVDPKIDAIILGPGTSLYYFTGIRWWLSERMLCLVLPRNREPILISPAFEEGRLRESLRYPTEVRVWQEDESPSKLIAAVLVDRKMNDGRIGIEERLPFTFYDHIREATPGCTLVSADAVTIGCRALKSAHELELMRLACEATFAVYREVFGALKEGMSQGDIGQMISTGFGKMELRGDALVLIGASAALPHGSKMPQKLKEGNVVLIDGGCIVEGYESDVTRTGVFGKPSAKVQQVYEIVRQAQDAALEAARAGKLSGTVDDAARAVITNAGYGPDYKFFTHRLGHGIGLDGHEHPYLVRGSNTVLAPGMTFSNEPGIYIPGEFGLRCEDDMVITADGPAKLLTAGFQVSLEKPLG